jgi:hypothetical protein
VDELQAAVAGARAGVGGAIARGLGRSYGDTGSLLLESLRRLRAQGHGTLVVLSSVAVARRTVGALGGRAHTVWAPGALRYMFAVVRLLPRAVFLRIPL